MDRFALSAAAQAFVHFSVAVSQPSAPKQVCFTLPSQLRIA